jgi:hypothetical protein
MIPFPTQCPENSGARWALARLGQFTSLAILAVAKYEEAVLTLLSYIILDHDAFLRSSRLLPDGFIKAECIFETDFVLDTMNYSTTSLVTLYGSFVFLTN